MGFKEAVRTGLRKWITFSGRASRSEYWWFYLGTVFLTLGVIALWAIPFLIIVLIIGDGLGGAVGGFLVWPVVIVAGLASLWIYIALMSALVRRLHDRNLSGWWLLAYIGLSFMAGASGVISPVLALILNVVSIIAALALFVVTVLRGTPGDNRYGPDPLVALRPEQVFE